MKKLNKDKTIGPRTEYILYDIVEIEVGPVNQSGMRSIWLRTDDDIEFEVSLFAPGSAKTVREVQECLKVGFQR